ncbi:MAG TPA: ATP-binding protein [archaeon]|nr:ATP-binding protein [archaeon]
MGLGLILVNKILQSYEGIIKIKDRIKDDYAKGSKFIIYLPEAL